MLIDLKQILELAERKQVAIPAFNMYNMESVIGVMRAAQETNAPVIFQLYTRLAGTEYGAFVANAIKEAIRQLQTPAAFHLDHGAGIHEIVCALRFGVSGAMIDASTLPLEENIEKTRMVVNLCRECNVPVEAELGHVGATSDEKLSDFTDVGEAKRFAAETGVSALAVMVGTAHGVYKQAPVLDIQRISDIRNATGLPLVLHGGSGVPVEQLKMAVDAGIRKVNFATDLCYAFWETVYGANGTIKAMDVLMADPIEAIRKYAVTRIRQLGADQILF